MCYNYLSSKKLKRWGPQLLPHHTFLSFVLEVLKVERVYNLCNLLKKWKNGAAASHNTPTCVILDKLENSKYCICNSKGHWANYWRHVFIKQFYAIKKSFTKTHRCFGWSNFVIWIFRYKHQWILSNVCTFFPIDLARKIEIVSK